MDTVSGETFAPGYQNKGVCQRACVGFNAPYRPPASVSKDSSAVDLRGYAKLHKIALGDCRTTKELYLAITTGELPRKPKKSEAHKKAFLQGLSPKNVPAKEVMDTAGKKLESVRTFAEATATYRVEKSDADGLFHVFNQKTKHMHKKGFKKQADCEKAAAKLND